MNEFRVTILYKTIHPWTPEKVAAMIKTDCELCSGGNIEVDIETIVQVRDSA